MDVKAFEGPIGDNETILGSVLAKDLRTQEWPGLIPLLNRWYEPKQGGPQLHRHRKNWRENLLKGNAALSYKGYEGGWGRPSIGTSCPG